MADETVDLIEETNDDMENWLYYARETKTEENKEVNNFPEQQFIYIDSTDLVVNNNEQEFHYTEVDDNEIITDGQEEPIVEVVGEEQQHEENIDNLSKHNLIMRECIDENGQLVEGYYCQECNIPFNSIEEFLSYHPCTELLSDYPEEHNPSEPAETLATTVPQDKLWDLVENLNETEEIAEEDLDNIIEMKPNFHNAQLKEDSNSGVELDKERYFCYDCQQVFTDLTSAENHECSHQPPSAEEINGTKSTVVVKNFDNNMYRCNLCNKDYTTLRSFSNHQRCHKKPPALLGHNKNFNEETVICELCNTIFASEKNLKLHMKMHKKQTIKTIQEALPAGAQDEYNELNQFFCEICNKSFDQKLLVIHKNMHQNLKEYNCGKCNKQFENLPSYEIHMQMHVDNITNVKKTTMAKKLNSYINNEESPSTSSQAGGGKRKHACQYCGKEFQRPYEKVKHERIHTGEKPYECEVCGKTFRVSYSLTLHLRTHTDIRPYVCATCNKRFKQQSVYVHHLKTHVVERGYKCDICGKSFRTSVQLIGHRNTHSKPYNCTECSRPFASLYLVKIHMKTHNKCHKSNKNLKDRCNICGASYARIFALRFHLKEQHGIEIDPGQLLVANSAQSSVHKEMGAAQEAGSQQQMHFLNIADDENDDDSDEDEANDDVDRDDNEDMFSNQVDHEENIHNALTTSNSYLDETEAATQAILNTQEISVDNFPTEEIVTDWLSK